MITDQAPALSFDLPLGEPDNTRLGVLYAVGNYWCWSQAFAPGAEPLPLLEWTEAGIVDFTSAGYSLHVVRAGVRHLFQGLFDFWLISDADHIWVQVPRAERRHYVLIAGGRAGVNLRHSIAWHCQECGNRLATDELSHDGSPARFIEAQANAVAAFNVDVARRTCACCGALHPSVGGFSAQPGDVLLATGRPDEAQASSTAAASVPFGTCAAQLSDLEEGTPTAVWVGGQRLLLVRDGESVYAADSVCPHRGGPLETGEVRDAAVTCPWHRFRFDLRTGACVTNSKLRVATFPVELAGNDVIIHSNEQGGNASCA